MKIQHIAMVVALSAGLLSQASAATFDGATGAPQNVVTNFSAGSLLSFDIDFASKSNVTLNFTVEAGDLGSPLAFNALARNLTGLGFESVYISLGGVTFATPNGSITTDGFQAVSSSGASATSAWATFSPALTTEFYIGNPLVSASAVDWTLNLGSLQAGDRFSVTVVVPEAESYAMAIAGLSVLGLIARRRKAA